MGFTVDVLLPLALAVIMLSLGLGLTFDDFARVVRRPRDFAVGALSQVVLLPAVAFVLASIWPMAPELAVGLMIIAAAPGGATSNILTAFARGDVALSISLTAVISLLSVITIPIIVAFAYGRFLGEQASREVSVAGAAIDIFLIVAVPVLIGLFARRFAEDLALRVGSAAPCRLRGVVRPRARRRHLPGTREHRALFRPGRAGHPGLQRGDDGASLAARPHVRQRSEPADRDRDRMRAAERNACHRGRRARGRRRARDRPVATYSLTMFATALVYIAVLRRRSG